MGVDSFSRRSTVLNARVAYLVILGRRREWFLLRKSKMFREVTLERSPLYRSFLLSGVFFPSITKQSEGSYQW